MHIAIGPIAFMLVFWGKVFDLQISRGLTTLELSRRGDIFFNITLHHRDGVVEWQRGVGAVHAFKLWGSCNGHRYSTWTPDYQPQPPI